MKRTLIGITLVLLAQQAVLAEESMQTDLGTIASRYFAAWTESQKPAATQVELEAYLALLKEDVGHQHFPYDLEDQRTPDGKSKMREGMSYYLGAHTKYNAELKNVVTGHKVIVLQYVSLAQGLHPDTGNTVSIETEMLEVLELEDGLVSMIRKYGE